MLVVRVLHTYTDVLSMLQTYSDLLSVLQTYSDLLSVFLWYIKQYFSKYRDSLISVYTRYESRPETGRYVRQKVDTSDRLMSSRTYLSNIN